MRLLVLGPTGVVGAEVVREALQDARFMLGATRVGMAPDAGLSLTLTRLAGLRQALALALLNPMLDARQAHDLGLVTEVLQDEEAGLSDDAKSQLHAPPFAARELP